MRQAKGSASGGTVSEVVAVPSNFITSVPPLHGVAAAHDLWFVEQQSNASWTDERKKQQPRRCAATRAAHSKQPNQRPAQPPATLVLTPASNCLHHPWDPHAARTHDSKQYSSCLPQSNLCAPYVMRLSPHQSVTLTSPSVPVVHPEAVWMLTAQVHCGCGAGSSAP